MESQMILADGNIKLQYNKGMRNWKELWVLIKDWESKTLAFLRSFVLTFATQIMALGVDRLDDLRTYLISAGASLLALMIAWLNPKDNRFGVGSKPDGT